MPIVRRGRGSLHQCPLMYSWVDRLADEASELSRTFTVALIRESEDRLRSRRCESIGRPPDATCQERVIHACFGTIQDLPKLGLGQTPMPRSKRACNSATDTNSQPRAARDLR